MYKGIFDNDHSNEFFRQFDLLRENMKELNFFMSIICRIVFNDEKYGKIQGLKEDDILGIAMLQRVKDKPEMTYIKEQFVANSEVDIC